MSEWSEAHKYRNKKDRKEYESISTRMANAFSILETDEGDWERRHHKKKSLWSF